MPTWTRRPTFHDSDNTDDWSVKRDGLVVGRVHRDDSRYPKVNNWLWSVITTPTAKGYAATMEEGLEKVRLHASDKWSHVPYE